MQGNLPTAVLGYGSLMNNLQSLNYHTHERYGSTLQVHLDQDSRFTNLEKVGKEGEKVFRIDPSLTLPVSLKGKAGEGTPNCRFTRVIDPGQGIPSRPVAYAISDNNSLGDAIKDVAAREGASATSRYICYLTKDQQRGGTTIRSSNRHNYKGNIGVLNETQAKKIADWAEQHGFGSVVWASFAVKTSPSERTRELNQDRETLLNNTKQYILDVPSFLRSDAEKAILSM